MTGPDVPDHSSEKTEQGSHTGCDQQDPKVINNAAADADQFQTIVADFNPVVQIAGQNECRSTERDEPQRLLTKGVKLGKHGGVLLVRVNFHIEYDSAAGEK